MTKKDNEPLLVLVDGSSYLYRAFHALPSLATSSGQPTGAIKGVISMLRKLINEYQPDYLAVIFDAKGKTFRDAMFAEYKANRPPMPDELQQQIEPIYNIIKLMGIPLLSVEGVEADDVIGTLVTQAKQQGLTSLVSTSDKDIAQLVNDSVTLINTMTDTVLDIEGVKTKFGVPPERIVDYLSLIGDSVDNIPGVPKVGPKTAVKWLHEYGSLDGIISHADQIKGVVGGNLRESLGQLPLSQELTMIKTDVELDKGPTDFMLQPKDEAQLIELYKEFEFKAWLDELLSDSESLNFDANYSIVLTKSDFNQWVEKLESADLFAFDTETTSVNYMEAELVGLSFAVKPGEAAYVPLTHDYLGAPDQLARDWVLQQLRPLLENPKKTKVLQNVKYDMSVLARYDIALAGANYDSMLESYVLNSVGTRHDMDSLALKYLGRTTIHFEDIAGKGAKQLTFNQIELDIAGPYAAEDADITLQLHQNLWSLLQEQKLLVNVLSDIEMPLVSVLSRIERHGTLVDAPLLVKQSKELAVRLLELEQSTYDLAGEIFNLASPKQLQAILFEKLALPIIKKTPKGQPSTAEAVLQELALDYPLPKLILEHRSLSKLKSTYTDKLPLQINSATGRVHTSYHQAVTATGRLSSSDPNLQNIPVRTAEGRRIRQAFIAPENYSLLAADYSQIELRIMAHLSKDQGLCQAFAEGLDIHKATAAEVFSVPVGEVSNEQRRSAKAINFGLIYGMSAFGLAKQLGISRHAAKNYIDVYFDRYPGVLEYMQSTREQAHHQGYVETLYGRRLYLPDINSSNRMRKEAAERTAINAPMQGTAADIIKRAMITIDEWLLAQPYQASMVMQVHDELVFEIAKNQVGNVRSIIQEKMCQAAKLSVPLVVDIGVGSNWDEAH